MDEKALATARAGFRMARARGIVERHGGPPEFWGDRLFRELRAKRQFHETRETPPVVEVFHG